MSATNALNIRVGKDYFYFESLPGNPMQLEKSKLLKSSYQRADELFRSRHTLSQILTDRIAAHIKYSETWAGWMLQNTVGLCFPSGLLLGNVFDLDRDTVLLRNEIVAVLSDIYPNVSLYDLRECIQEGQFRHPAGRVLFRLYL